LFEFAFALALASLDCSSALSMVRRFTVGSIEMKQPSGRYVVTVQAQPFRLSCVSVQGTVEPAKAADCHARRVLALSGEKKITVSEALALLKSTGIALVVRIFCRSGETQHNRTGETR
jgi:hypothetical protein